MADDSSLAPGQLDQVLSETSFLYGGNGAFVEDLYARWAADPSSVEPSWGAFFPWWHAQPGGEKSGVEPPPWAPAKTRQSRPEWVSAIDGMWPAVEAKLG